MSIGAQGQKLMTVTKRMHTGDARIIPYLHRGTKSCSSKPLKTRN